MEYNPGVNWQMLSSKRYVLSSTNIIKVFVLDKHHKTSIDSCVDKSKGLEHKLFEFNC